MRTSASHEEGCERDWAIATNEFVGENGKVKKLKMVRVEWKEGKLIEGPGSGTEIKADLVLLAMGFLGPTQSGLIEQIAVEKEARGNVKADTARAQDEYICVPVQVVFGVCAKSRICRPRSRCSRYRTFR